MNRAELVTLDGSPLVNSLTNDVHDTSECTLSNRHHDGVAGIDNLLPTNETFRTIHSNGSDRVLTQMGGNLENEAATSKVLHLQGIENRW